MYSSILDKYICQCAEFILFNSYSKWQSFVNDVDHFFQYYELTNTEEYQSFQYSIQLNHNFLLSDDSLEISDYYSREKQVLRTLIELKKYKNTVPKFFDRLFISHSSRDTDIVAPFVRLLSAIGLNRDRLFCSSVDGYGIPQRENIYDFLKREFTEKNTFVVMMMSDNYYNSKPSLNEMGAAWAMSKEYVSILIKGFNFNKIEGAVDAQKIGFKIEDQYRLDEFKDNIVKEFRLPHIWDWQEIKNRFLQEIKRANNK